MRRGSLSKLFKQGSILSIIIDGHCMFLKAGIGFLLFDISISLIPSLERQVICIVWKYALFWSVGWHVKSF
jgi:hypothetical protein